MSIHKHVAVGAATLLAASALTVAAAAPSSAASPPCGYYTEGNAFFHSSWYNYCGSGWALVYVNAGLDYKVCLRHGDHELHTWKQNILNYIDNAYKIGVCR